MSISSVRNPWDRLVSLFYNVKRIDDRDHEVRKTISICQRLKVPLDVEWEDFIVAVCKSRDVDSNIHYRSQHCFHPTAVDVLIRFERLDTDWQIVRQWHPDLPDIGWENKTDHRPFGEYYTPEMAVMVGKRYECDVERYGYVSPYPN